MPVFQFKFNARGMNAPQLFPVFRLIQLSSALRRSDQNFIARDKPSTVNSAFKYSSI